MKPVKPLLAALLTLCLAMPAAAQTEQRTAL